MTLDKRFLTYIDIEQFYRIPVTPGDENGFWTHFQRSEIFWKLKPTIIYCLLSCLFYLVNTMQIGRFFHLSKSPYEVGVLYVQEVLCMMIGHTLIWNLDMTSRTKLLNCLVSDISYFISMFVLITLCVSAIKK